MTDRELNASSLILSKLLDDLVAALQRHVIMAQPAYWAVALWIVHSWVFDKFDHTPRLAITSPTRRCGKSTLLDVIFSTSRRPQKADNVTPAAVYRLIEADRPTWLIDEADTFLSGRNELRGVLNSGYEKSGNVVRIHQRGEHGVASFATFTPVAIAGIDHLPPTLADRAIPIRMERRPHNEPITKLRDGNSREVLQDLAARCEQFAQTCPSLSMIGNVPDSLNDRQGDISVPLLAIADAAAQAWPARARYSLVELFWQAGKESDAELSVRLLTDLYKIFDAQSSPQGEGQMPDWLSSQSIVDALVAHEDRPWGELPGTSRPLSTHALARLLQPHGVTPCQRWVEAKGRKSSIRGYSRSDLERLWQIYLGPEHKRFADTLGRASADFDLRPGRSAEEAAISSTLAVGHSRNRRFEFTDAVMQEACALHSAWFGLFDDEAPFEDQLEYCALRIERAAYYEEHSRETAGTTRI